MPAFSVSKSIQINAPLAKVYECVRDFHQWPRWSPWLIAEPGCELVYADDGGSYTWDGRIVGSGELAVTGEDAPNAIDYKLSFFKPWKSVNTSRFLFTGKDGGTEVTWTMNGKLPFLLFWMKGMMTAFIGMDYERGLSMLKDLLESGEVPSRLEFHSATAVPGFRYVGIRSTCAIADLGRQMEVSFGRLVEFFGEKEVQASGRPFSIYHKWKMVDGLAEVTSGIPVEKIPAVLPGDMVTGEVPSCTTYAVKHTGPYRHLGNAWSAGELRARAKPKIFERDRKVDPFEVYENDPDEVPENEVVTVVHFPEK